MISYIDDFKLMFIITLCAMPLVLLLRYKPMPKGAQAAHQPVAVMAD